MLKKIITLILLTLSLTAYDFGDIPEVNAADIPIGKRLMIQFGKTECIWCEHMAPYLKEIKENYPNTQIYYVNTDNDILGTINYNIQVLPTAVFLDEEGKELGRVVGYLTPEKIISALIEYDVLVK